MDQPGQVDDLLLADIEPARLVRGAEGGHHESCGDQGEQQAGDLEEAGEVDVDATAIDAVAQEHGYADSEDRAQCRRHGVVAGVESRDEENRRFESLAEHREECHHHERDRRTLVDRVGGRGLQVALEIACVLTHPHNHVRDHRDGDDADDGFEAFLLALRQVARQHLESNGNSDADGDGDADPDPHPAQSVGAALASEEGRDDAHDERRLEPLAEADDEGREHVSLRFVRFAVLWLVSTALLTVSELRLRCAMRDHQGTNGTMVNR